MTWLKVRFQVPNEDPRPVTFPPPGPYWTSGETDGPEYETIFILIAYVHTEQELLEFWPDAQNLDIFEEDTQIKFYDRFPKPDWWKGEES